LTPSGTTPSAGDLDQTQLDYPLPAPGGHQTACGSDHHPHWQREATISLAGQLAARLRGIIASLPAGHLEGASEAIRQATGLMTALRGQDAAGLDTPIKHLQEAQRASLAAQATLERTAELIDTYVATVVGFHDPIWSAPAARPAITADPAAQLPTGLEAHIFQGEATPKKITGYHHRPGGIDTGTFRVTGQEPADSDGVYQATVEGHTSAGTHAVKAYTTFFPNAWTRNEVRRAIHAAFHGRHDVRNAKGAVIPRKWEGTYRGVRVQGYLRPGTDPCAATLDDVATAYLVPKPGVRRS
jgi:hypothetical protein